MVGLGCGFVVFNDFTFPVEEEFAKIPGDVFAFPGEFVEQGAVGTEELIKLVSFWAVDLDLCEHRESHIERVGDKLSDLLFSSTLLLTELVTREAPHNKTLVFVLLVEFDQLFVIVASQSASACYIDDQDGFGTLEVA